MTGQTSPKEAALAFFSAASTVETLEALQTAFASVAGAHGFQRGACVHIATPGEPVQPKVLFGFGVTAWADQYTRGRLSRYDPAIQAVFTNIRPVSWREIEAGVKSAEGQAVFDAARAAGARDGLIVPVHGPLGEVMSVSLVSEVIDTFDDQTRNTMHVAGTIFATRGLSLLEIERERTEGPQLSRREIQCVYWINKGKTDWEIGRILGIAEDTVAFHIQNAKKKLGVTTRAQLPNRAWYLGVLRDENP